MRARRSRFPRRHRPPALAGVGAMLGLLVYLLALYAAVPRSGLGGVGERTPGIVLARHRQAQFDAVADDRPFPRPSAPAPPPACMPAVLAPEPAGCSSADDAGSERAWRPLSPGSSRSPPAA